MSADELKDRIREKALSIGFYACGFAPARLDARHAQNLKTFVDQGRHASLAWMETRQEQRASPHGLWPDVKSVIVLGTNYGPAIDPTAIFNQKDRGAISVYAQGKDYHDVVKKRLKQLGR